VDEAKAREIRAEALAEVDQQQAEKARRQAEFEAEMTRWDAEIEKRLRLISSLNEFIPDAPSFTARGASEPLKATVGEPRRRRWRNSDEPRGQEAVYRVLVEAGGCPMTVREITAVLVQRGWAPATDRDPMRPTGNAAARLLDRPDVHRRWNPHGGYDYWHEQPADADTPDATDEPPVNTVQTPPDDQPGNVFALAPALHNVEHHITPEEAIP